MKTTTAMGLVVMKKIVTTVSKNIANCHFLSQTFMLFFIK